jgi:hypothetical protein
MKFCYIDESGTGSEPYAVMVAIIVNSSRMQVTKKDWVALLKALSMLIGKTVKEFHTRDFYSGNDIWRGLDGDKRSKIIDIVFDWIKKRKHKISFCAVDKEKYKRDFDKCEKLKDIGSLWCVLGLHLILSIQKAHQTEGIKGSSVIIFDEELFEKKRILNLLKTPPVWTDTYYSKRKKDDQMNTIVDAPFFGDSETVHLLQIADFVAYILRRHLEINDAKLKEKYEGEAEKIKGWVNLIAKLSLPSSSRYPKVSRCKCSDLFYEYAPISIKNI